MKTCLLSLLSILCFSIASQSKNLSGSWREIKRVNHEGDVIRINDTIFINFLAGNEYTWQKKKDFVHRGSYKYDGKVIDMATRFFTVLQHTNKTLILRDRYATYEFEAFKPSREQLPDDKNPSSINDIGQIVGKWNVFKRTSGAVMKNIDYSTLVEDVVIEKRDTSWGYISASSKPQEKDGWKIVKLENGILYAEGKTSRRFKVSKRDNELILTEGNLTYFLKQFQE